MRRVIVAAALLFLGGFSGRAAKPIMAHYMPWFVAEPFSASWGWHWTMNYFNPNISNNDQREIASWYYPLVGPYDSDDSPVLEYQVLLMKLAGIDGVIVDWYGNDNYADYAVNNIRTVALAGYVRKAGLKFSLCYEDATIGQEVSGGYITAANAVAHAQQTMLYAQSNFFNDPSYLRWSNAPVLLNFGPQYFTNAGNWPAIFSVLNASNQPAFFTEDNPVMGTAGAFDWPPMGESQTNNGILTTNQVTAYVAAFARKAAVSHWSAFVSSAFPRFHDIYAQANVKPSYGNLDDASGAVFQSTLIEALTNQSAVVQLVTWNDYGEGTIIEPTTQYGYRDLEVVQNYRRQFVDSNFMSGANDLTLALRLYNLRRQYAANAVMGAELDRAFNNVVEGNLGDAGEELSGAEEMTPVLYRPVIAGNQFQFLIGGYLSSNGVQIQKTADLTQGWQVATNWSAGTNALEFSATIPASGGATFFRVRGVSP